MEIKFENFIKFNIQVGTIIDVKENIKAKKPAYVIDIDFGEKDGIKKSSAQITNLYNSQDLIGKSILAVINLPPRQIGPFISDVLVLGLNDENNSIVLAVPDKIVPNGSKLI